MLPLEVDLEQDLGAAVTFVHQFELELLLTLVVGEVADLEAAVGKRLVSVEDAPVVNDLEVDVVVGVGHVVLPVAAHMPFWVAALAVIRFPVGILELNHELGFEVLANVVTVAGDVGSHGVDLDVAFVCEHSKDISFNYILSKNQGLNRSTNVKVKVFNTNRCIEIFAQF